MQMSTYESHERGPAGNPQGQDEDWSQPCWCGPHEHRQDGEKAVLIKRGRTHHYIDPNKILPWLYLFKSTMNNERRIWENYTNNIVLWSRCALTVLEVWVDTSQHLRRWWSFLSSTQRSLKGSRYSPPGKWCVFEQVNLFDWFRGGQWCVTDIHAQVCLKCWLNPKLIPHCWCL